jgi:hypothetical protein
MPSDSSELHIIGIQALSNLETYGLELDGSLPLVAPVDGGNWLVAELRREAERWDDPLGEFEEWALIHGPAQFTDEMRGAILHLNNRAVSMIRHRIELYKKAGVPTIVVRKGLRLPVIWEANYEPVYLSELPWFISAIMQNVFMGNPLAGERKPWVSK